jgi:O-antigen/teichoic acid export membrane protein
LISKIKNIINTDNQDLSELISKSGASLVLRVIGMLLMYIFFFLVSNFYGAGAVGVYSLCYAVLNIGVVFSHWGYHSAALRYISEFEAKNNWSAVNKTYKLSLIVPLILSVIISFIIYFNAGFIGEKFFGETSASAAHNIQLVAYSVLPLTVLLIHLESLRALRKIKENAFLQNVALQGISILILFIPLYYNMHDDSIPFLTRVIAHFIVAAYCIWYWMRTMKKEQPQDVNGTEDLEGVINLRMMTMMALPLFLASSTRLILDWTDTLMLGIYTTEENVGIYNTALKIAMLANLPELAVNSIAAPKFSAFYHNSMFKEFKKYVQHATNLNCYTTLPMILVLAVFPDFVLGLFGEEFIIGRNTLWLLLIGKLVSTFSGSVGYILQMTNRQHIFQRLILMAAAINVALNYWLIPIWGIEGAAFASMVSMALWNMSCAAYIYFKMNVVTVFIPSYKLFLRLLKNQRNPDV